MADWDDWSEICFLFEQDFIGQNDTYTFTLTILAWEQCFVQKSLPKTAETSNNFSP